MRSLPASCRRLALCCNTLQGFVLIGSTFALAPGAEAHLSIIRQGLESVAAPEPGDYFGSALAAGDFDGDGYDDLATGAPGEAAGNLDAAGAVVISFGTEFGLTHLGAQFLTESVPAADDEFGFALAAADFDDDGYVDLAIGAPGVDGGGGATDAGLVYIFRGSASGLVPWHSLSQFNLGGAVEANDRFGAALAVGNLDGLISPAHMDLAIGSPGENGEAGAVFYVLGTGGGLFGASGSFLQSTLGGTDVAGDRFGFSLATGNVMGSLVTDLVVGAPFKDPGAIDAGAVYVIAGTSTGPTATGAFSFTAREIDVLTAGGMFGRSLAIGHLADEPAGYRTLAIGEPGWDFDVIDESGRVHLIAGASTGLDLAAADYLNVFALNGGGSAYLGDRVGWTVAAGRFDADDGYDDLAVGAPYARFSPPVPESGLVFISFGGPTGPGGYGFAAFNQATLNDPVEGGERLGEALAFGRFDATSNGHLVAGAPGEDAKAGQVHVIAPWRQVYDLLCLHSVAFDCEDNLIFSQKGFDRVWIASTTKIMTVLVACEQAQLGNVPLDELVDIPDWVVNDVGGSQVPLAYGEKMTLRNLLYTCLMRSGNDAAYAIADYIFGQGGPSISVPAFLAVMNLRAAEIGMVDTHFHNPAGLDAVPVGPVLGAHHSTAEDMARLGRAAMANDLFREIVATTQLTIVRQGEAFGVPWQGTWTTGSSFAWLIDNASFPEGSGIKGGWTPNAELTGVFSADDELLGTAVAGTFHTDNATTPIGVWQNQAVAVLGLGLEACGATVTYEPVDPRDEHVLPHLSTEAGIRTGGAADVGYGGPDTHVAVDFCRQAGEGTTNATIEILRLSEAAIGRDALSWGVAPFEAHDDIRLMNLGAGDADIRLTLSYTAPFDLHLASGEAALIPAYGGPDTSELGMTIENLDPRTDPVHLSFEALYRYEVAFPPGPCVGPAFSAVFPRDALLGGDSFDIQVLGQDPNPGSELLAILHEAGTVVDVDSDVTPGAAMAVALRANPPRPNPFHAGTRIGFQLRDAGAVQVSIFDASGRRLRAFPEEILEPGIWSVRWDGSDARGLPVSSGVYFYRIRLDGVETASGKLVRSR